MSTIVIDHRFHGPANSGNGGYVCGRLAKYIGGVPTVRLRVPPPLGTALEVQQTPSGVFLVQDTKIIAEGRLAELDLDIPEAPDAATAETASRHFRGFES